MKAHEESEVRQQFQNLNQVMVLRKALKDTIDQNETVSANLTVLEGALPLKPQFKLFNIISFKF